jgi:DNA-binding NarL/FixJ family response regulator
MPNSDGAETARELRTTQPHIGAVLLSQHVELRNCLDLIGTPRFGYLLKDRVLHLDDFADALNRVATGGIAPDPLVVQALVRNHNTPTALTHLSDRERQVLSLVAEGHSNTAVARTLTVSERTVEAHMRSIFTKLDLPDDQATNRRVRAVIAWLQAQP